MLALPSKPGWLGGAALMVLGGALHVVALSMAPVALIQPIGVLGVPIAVLLAARLDHRRPSVASVIPILTCVVGIGGFVALAAGQLTATDRVPLPGLLIAQGLVLSVIIVTAVLSRRMTGWRRCLSNAVAGAMGVGMVAALMRALTEYLQAGPTGLEPARLIQPEALCLVGLMILSGAAGGWLVQQAYAHGPAEVVLASLTVVDPMIAVLIGLLVLGEGARLDSLMLLGVLGCAALAVIGVITLARSHPDGTGCGRGGSSQQFPGRPTPSQHLATRLDGHDLAGYRDLETADRVARSVKIG